MAAATSEEGREIRELKERLRKAEMMVSEVLEFKMQKKSSRI